MFSHPVAIFLCLFIGAVISYGVTLRMLGDRLRGGTTYTTFACGMATIAIFLALYNSMHPAFVLEGFFIVFSIGMMIHIAHRR